MARLSLSKSQLAKEKASLAQYRRFLPSLDMKRKQLAAEKKSVQEQLEALTGKEQTLLATLGSEMPMLADERINISHLVELESIQLGEKNVVGQRLPVLEDIQVKAAEYGFMTRPHWVDQAAVRLKEVLMLRVEARVLQKQAKLLEKAVTKVTQRVNLFEKVLIPRAGDNIRRIQIALSDHERAAVVNSKIAKRKREEEQA